MKKNESPKYIFEANSGNVYLIVEDFKTGDGRAFIKKTVDNTWYKLRLPTERTLKEK